MNTMNQLYDDDILDTALVGPVEDGASECHVPYCTCGLPPSATRLEVERLRRPVDDSVTP